MTASPVTADPLTLHSLSLLLLPFFFFNIRLLGPVRYVLQRHQAEYVPLTLRVEAE